MKKFTKKVTKAVLTLAAVLAFNLHAQSTPPTSESQYFDSSNWSEGATYTNFAQTYDTNTGTWLEDVSGEYVNHGWIYGINQYGIYSNSILNSVDITNFGMIGHSNNTKNIGVVLKGMNGDLWNEENGQINSGLVGIVIDGTNAESSGTDFEITNYGDISSRGIGIYKLNNNRNLFINNTRTGSIIANDYAILSANGIEIQNDNLIESIDSAAIFLLNGGVITNNGLIESRIENSISSMDDLTLKGNGKYVGHVEYVGNGQGVLNLRDANIDFQAAELYNWTAIGIDGGIQHFNVLNDAQNPSAPQTLVFATSNSTIYSGDGQWGDGNFAMIDSLLNPYENKQSDFWNDGAKVNNGRYNVSLYDRKNFEKLTVNNLSLFNGGLVLDVRLSEPDYNPSNPIFSEDDRAGYWDIYSPGDNDFNPDGSYGGLGYNHRYKRISDNGPTDLYTFQRINHDKIDVRGVADVSGGSLYILDQTKWIDENGYSAPDFEEDETSLDHLELDVLDGNITFEDFGSFEFYSDYFGVDHVDSTTGTIYLTRDAYNSNVKGQIDWWLKQTSLGFKSSEPGVALPTMSTALTAPAPMAFQTTADATPTSKMSGVVIPTVSSVQYNDDPQGSDDYDDDESTSEPKSESLPYEVVKDYSAKITDLDASVELQSTIYSFQNWNDVDAFMDTLNKLEYASLATSNLNLISNRVYAMYNRLGAGYDLRDNNNVSIWADLYFSNDSLDGGSNHGIDGHGTEFAVGLDKLFNDKFTLGMSFNHSNYQSIVNDSGINDKIDSEGYGLNAYAMLKQGAFSHKMMLGFANYENTGDNATFDSNELFAAYRAEYTVNRPGFNATWIAGIRYSKVEFDEMREDAENGLKSFDQDSLETELGLELSKQFKRLGVSVSGVWMHELLDSQTTAQAFTSFGDFSQKGIARDTDSFRATIGFEYQLSDKVTLDFDYSKEVGERSESDSINGKITFRF